MIRFLLVSIVVLLTFEQLSGQDDCNCWDKEFADQDMTYDTAIRQLEDSLIAIGHLQDETPDSYVRLIDSIIENNKYDLISTEVHPILFSKFQKCFLQSSCSKLCYEKIRTMDRIVSDYTHIAPSQTFSEFKEVFSKSDFNENEVKHYLLTFYSVAFSMGTENSLELIGSIATGEIKHDSLRTILQVLITTEDSIFFNDTYVEIQHLKTALASHISDVRNSKDSIDLKTVNMEGLGERKVSDYLVSVQCHSSSYNLYVRLFDEIYKAFTEARNNIALEEFGISYDTMLENKDKFEREIKIVHRIVPKRISEAPFRSE
ncbi:hypothetical protein [Sanyastnella coralliicola]|uniref:hypothetical protein n=1 Tax=Sanyastnella coralliicola TaxID=3069118 RepID=UPI0027BA08A8|nr:hypothetical protein [Longitalea sp. SCSIO 12813]